MKKTTLSFLMALLVSGGSICGESRQEWHIVPTFGYQFGDTRFESHWFESDTSGRRQPTGGSELIYPLDFRTVGVEIGSRTVRDGHELWSARARLAFSASQPGDKMIDRDWYDVAAGEEEFSWTESTAEGSWLEAELEFTRLLKSGKGHEIALVVGLKHQKVQQDLIDLSGWQVDLDVTDSLVIYSGAIDTLAGTYEIRYFWPLLGLKSRINLAERWRVELTGTVSPLVYAKDIDDHVLRLFQIRTDGNGFGSAGRLAFVYDRGDRSGAGLYLRIEANYSRTAIDATGIRNYYGDSEGGEVSAGDIFRENHRITGLVYGLRLAFGLRL